MEELGALISNIMSSALALANSTIGILLSTRLFNAPLLAFLVAIDMIYRLSTFFGGDNE